MHNLIENASVKEKRERENEKEKSILSRKIFLGHLDKK